MSLFLDIKSQLFKLDKIKCMPDKLKIYKTPIQKTNFAYIASTGNGTKEEMLAILNQFKELSIKRITTDADFTLTEK